MTAEDDTRADLRGAVRAFVDAAIGLLAIEPVDDGGLDAAAVRQLQPGGPLWEAILGLQANLAVCHLLESDPIIGQRLGKVMVTGSSTRPIESFEEETPTFLANFARTGKPHDSEAFDKAFDAWREDLFRVSEERVQLSPLVGFLCDGEAIQMTPSLALRPLTSDELAFCLRARLIDGIHSTDGVTPNEDSRWCVAGRLTADRVLVASDADPALPRLWAEWNRQVQEVDEAADDVVVSLRLYGSGDVRFGGRITPSGGGSVISPTRRLRPEGDPQILGRDELGEVKHLWESLTSESVRRSTALQASLRRFEFALDRSLDEDQVIDLMIAAESWFLGGDKGELSFRLALNAANFMRVARRKRPTFEFIKHAYQVRSKIVHGGKPAAGDLVLEDGTRTDMPTFALALHDFMRDALRTAVRQVAAGEWREDWDGLALEEPPMRV